MANIRLTGSSLDPNSRGGEGDQYRFTSQQFIGNTPKGAISYIHIGVNGTYDVTLAYGVHLVEFKDKLSPNFVRQGIVTINADTPNPANLGQLLAISVPATPEIIAQMQSLLADTEAAAAGAIGVKAIRLGGIDNSDQIADIGTAVNAHIRAQNTLAIGEKVNFTSSDGAVQSEIYGSSAGSGIKKSLTTPHANGRSETVLHVSPSDLMVALTSRFRMLTDDGAGGVALFDATEVSVSVRNPRSSTAQETVASALTRKDWVEAQLASVLGIQPTTQTRQLRSIGEDGKEVVEEITTTELAIPQLNLVQRITDLEKQVADLLAAQAPAV